MFTFSIKREIRHFYVVSVQRRQTNVQKGLLSLRSRRWILKSLLTFNDARSEQDKYVSLTTFFVWGINVKGVSSAYRTQIEGHRRALIH